MPTDTGWSNRVQLDIQELPAIRGNRKREYKISLIHLRTRLKYSEILTTASSKRVAEVLQRALKRGADGTPPTALRLPRPARAHRAVIVSR
jgi:hypothetical protein